MAGASSTPEMRSVRLLKVGEQVRHILSELLMRGEVHDDVLAAHSVSVTEVRMSPDLRHAMVFVKPLLGANEEDVLKALRTNTAYFQREVAARLGAQICAEAEVYRRRELRCRCENRDFAGQSKSCAGSR